MDLTTFFKEAKKNNVSERYELSHGDNVSFIKIDGKVRFRIEGGTVNERISNITFELIYAGLKYIDFYDPETDQLTITKQ